MCNSLQIRCQNPECKTPLIARQRYDENGNTLFFACDDCMKLLHGPHKYRGLPEYCGKCGSFFGWEPCNCRIEFLYGGPLVICETCHKQTVWLDSQSGTGFAGGMIYLDTFSCGHNIMDQSADMAAAY